MSLSVGEVQKRLTLLLELRISGLKSALMCDLCLGAQVIKMLPGVVQLGDSADDTISVHSRLHILNT